MRSQIKKVRGKTQPLVNVYVQLQAPGGAPIGGSYQVVSELLAKRRLFPTSHHARSLCRIGVSNYTVEDHKELMVHASIPPTVNQV